MLQRDLLRAPLAFLLRFAVIAALLFLLRGQIAQFYLAVVAPPANWLLESVDARYLRDGFELALSYPRLGLRFTVHDVVYQNLLVAVALFAATPAGWRWRLGWGASAVVLLWASHVVSLYLGAQVIVWDFVWGLPAEARAEIGPRVAALYPQAYDGLSSRLFGLWHAWGRQGLALAVWALASLPVLQAWTSALPTTSKAAPAAARSGGSGAATAP